MVEFAGWELPVQFAGVMPEHLHTRAHASLFDVSHMGQVLVRPVSGSMEDAAAALERLIPSSILGLAQHRQRYGLFTDERGGILDDLMVSHHGDRFLLVVNAARTAHDLQWLAQLDGVTVEHVTDRALLALQGPEAEAALATLIPTVTRCTFMDSLPMEWDGREVWVSRSGYTGEDGFEISVPDTRCRAVRPRPPLRRRRAPGRPRRAGLAAAGGRHAAVRARSLPRRDPRAGRARVGRPEGTPRRWVTLRRLPRR